MQVSKWITEEIQAPQQTITVLLEQLFKTCTSKQRRMLQRIYVGSKHIKLLFMNLTNFQALKNDLFVSDETLLDINETIEGVVKHQNVEASQDRVTIKFLENALSQREKVLADSTRISLVLENVLR